MASKKEPILFKPSSDIIDRKSQKSVGGMQEALEKVSCKLYFDFDVPAIVIQDIDTGDMTWIVVENGSMGFYDSKSAACAARDA